MAMFETILFASAVVLSGGAIAYTLHVVRKIAEFEDPNDAQIRHMIDTAPRSKFDETSAR